MDRPDRGLVVDVGSLIERLEPWALRDPTVRHLVSMLRAANRGDSIVGIEISVAAAVASLALQNEALLQKCVLLMGQQPAPDVCDGVGDEVPGICDGCGDYPDDCRCGEVCRCGSTLPDCRCDELDGRR